MPILVLKLYAFINNPDQELILGSVNLSAFVAMLMVVLGAASRLSFDEAFNFNSKHGGWRERVMIFLNLTSTVLLILLLVDLVRSCATMNMDPIVYAFFLVWPFYAITAFASIAFVSSLKDEKLIVIYLLKDVVYSVLDLFSKAMFAWHTSSAAFGVAAFVR